MGVLTATLIGTSLVIGVGLMAYGFAFLVRGFGETRWESAKASFEGLAIGVHRQVIRYGVVQQYYPKITYSYIVNGHRYDSDVVSRDVPSVWQEEDKDAAVELGRALMQGGAAYYHPRNPEQSTLSRGLSRPRKSHFVAIVIGGLLTALLAIVLLVSVVP